MTKYDMPPFETAAAANSAMDAFTAAVESARQQFQIHDVVVIAKVLLRGPDDLMHAQTHSMLGDQHHALPMVAQAYGQLAAEHQALILRLRTPADLMRGGGHHG